MHLSINGTTFDVATDHSLRSALEARDRQQFREIWLNVGGGPAICALLNGKLGWLMYVRKPGDAGLSSRNPSFAGSASDFIEYELSNGQRDQYPASWALSETTILEALDYFLENRSCPPFVTWHDDGG